MHRQHQIILAGNRTQLVKDDVSEYRSGETSDRQHVANDRQYSLWGYHHGWLRAELLDSVTKVVRKADTQFVIIGWNALELAKTVNLKKNNYSIRPTPNILINESFIK